MADRSLTEISVSAVHKALSKLSEDTTQASTKETEAGTGIGRQSMKDYFDAISKQSERESAANIKAASAGRKARTGEGALMEREWKKSMPKSPHRFKSAAEFYTGIIQAALANYRKPKPPEQEVT